MMLWGFMAIVPTRKADVSPSLADVSSAVKQTLLHTGMQGKVLADAMALRESHLSRQLNEQGANLWRLLRAGRAFWMAFLKPLVELAGLTRDDVMTIFGAAPDAERDQREKKQDDEIAALKQQIADILRRLPAPSKDESDTRVA